MIIFNLDFSFFFASYALQLDLKLCLVTSKSKKEQIFSVKSEKMIVLKRILVSNYHTLRWPTQSSNSKAKGSMDKVGEVSL